VRWIATDTPADWLSSATLLSALPDQCGAGGHLEVAPDHSLGNGDVPSRETFSLSHMILLDMALPDTVV
jgi:hypothetical protein